MNLSGEYFANFIVLILFYGIYLLFEDNTMVQGALLVIFAFGTMAVATTQYPE